MKTLIIRPTAEENTYELVYADNPARTMKTRQVELGNGNGWALEAMTAECPQGTGKALQPTDAGALYWLTKNDGTKVESETSEYGWWYRTSAGHWAQAETGR